MAESIIEVADGFWNIRGSFKIGGIVDIGTQASLVRLATGNFVFLDAYTMTPKGQSAVADIVGDTAEIEAIINLHPFHTVHVASMQQSYPQARLYGTARHIERFPELTWEPERCEDPAFHKLYADDFAFSVPAGVDFISANENIHFSSVLALHRASATIHSDDTIMYLVFPKVMGLMGMRDSLGFHPTLAKALEKRAGAAADFRTWAEALIEDWGQAENLCAAHSATLLAADNRGASIAERLRKALGRCRTRLRAHERRYG